MAYFSDRYVQTTQKTQSVREFRETVFNIRMQFFDGVVTGYGPQRASLPAAQRAYFDQDVGPYMPSDATFFMLEHGKLLSSE